MKEKGMTLVELIAVIVVLAIVSLIAVPTVLNIISRVRLNALKDSAYGLVEAGTMYNAQYENTKNIRFDIENNEYTYRNTENDLQYKGYIKEGTVIINKKGKTTVCITDGINSAYKNFEETKVILAKEKTCDIPEDTYIVYLDGERTRDELTNSELTELLKDILERLDKKANQEDLDVVAGVVQTKADQDDLDVTTSVALANQEAIENLPTSEALDGLALKVQNLETNATTKGYVDDNINTLRSEIPSIEGLATSTQLNGLATKVKNLEDNSTTKGYVDDYINTLRSEIPSIENLATKSELNAVEVIASNAKTAAENAATKTELNAVEVIASNAKTAAENAATKTELNAVNTIALANQEAIKGLASTASLETVSSAAKAAQEAADSKPSLNDIYPVGSIYTSTCSRTDTSGKKTTDTTDCLDTAAKVKAKFGGEWEAYGQGRVLVGAGTDGTTGGAKTTSYTPAGTISGTTGSVALSLTQIPSHSHEIGEHTHSIPSLSGTASSSGAHTHAVTAKGTFSGASTNTNSKGGHSHTIDIQSTKGEASGYGLTSSTSFQNRVVVTTSAASIISTASSGAHTHAVTAKGSFVGSSTNTDSKGAHTHSVTTTASTTGAASGSTASAGGNASGEVDGHSHSFSATLSGTSANISTLQPYITVYMWKRTA